MTSGFFKDSDEPWLESQRSARKSGKILSPSSLFVPVESTQTRMRWSEKKFSSEFQKLFESLRWEGYHTYLSFMSREGFVDWVLARERVIFVELKTQKGKLEPEQERWRDILRAAKQEWYCFRPSQWEEIVEVLTVRRD